MPLQVDEGGGEALRRHIEALGRHRPHRHAPRRRSSGAAAASPRMEFADGRAARRRRRRLRRRHPPARRARPRRRPRGRRARRRRRRRRLPHQPTPTSARSARSPASSGRCLGLVAPGYTMAEVVADRLLGGDGHLPRRRPVDQAQAARRRRRQLRRRLRAGARRPRGRHRRPGRRRLQEARDVRRRHARCSAASSSATPAPTRRCGRWSGRALRRRPRGLPACPAGARAGTGAATCPTTRAVCSCNNVTAGAIRCAVTEGGCTDVAGGEGLHQGRHQLRLLRAAGQGARHHRAREVRRRGQQRAVRALRPLAGPQLFDVVRVQGLTHASASSSPRTARGRGCDICKPVVASILASLGTGHILDGEQAALQDTNDHFLANLQKDGTYSVVPRIPGGEITPEGLHRHRRGRPGLRPLHEDHRRPAHRPVRRPRRAAAADLAAARRRRLRVRPRLRQGAAHGEVVRRLDLVPLRRAGLGRPGHRPRAALPRPAQPAQAQARRVRLRPRVRRGPRQGLRRHRHRERLEPLRRRQRRLHARGTPSCSPRTSTPRPWSGPSTGSSCSTSAPPTGCSAPRRGSRSSRAASTPSARSIVDDSPRHRRRPRRRDGAPRRRLRGRVGGDPGRPGEAAPVRLLRQRPRPARPLARLRQRARPGPPRHRRASALARRPHRRHDAGGARDDRRD